MPVWPRICNRTVSILRETSVNVVRRSQKKSLLLFIYFLFFRSCVKFRSGLIMGNNSTKHTSNNRPKKNVHWKSAGSFGWRKYYVKMFCVRGVEWLIIDFSHLYFHCNAHIEWKFLVCVLVSVDFFFEFHKFDLELDKYSTLLWYIYRTCVFICRKYSHIRVDTSKNLNIFVILFS